MRQVLARIAHWAGTAMKELIPKACRDRYEILELLIEYLKEQS